MSLLGVGSVLQGVGAIASAFGGKDDPPPPIPPAEQAAIVREHERLMLQQKMDASKQYGIHPLSMLGVPTSGFSPVISTGGGSSGRDVGADLQSVGYGVSQIGKAFVKPPEEDPLTVRLRDAEVRSAEANAKLLEWRALGEEFRVADMAAPPLLVGQPGNPPGARVSNDVVQLRNLAAEMSGISPSLIRGGDAPITMEQNILPPHPSKLGHAAGTDQSMIPVMGPDGRPGSVLNQNAIQAEFNDGATMTLLTRLYGVERATEIMAVLEQKGLIGGVLAAAGAGAKLWYDRMARQRAEALSRRKSPRRPATNVRRDARGRFVRGGD